MGDWTPGYRPSNGTMGDEFRAEWCNNCVHDIRDDCPIYSMALITDKGPSQWESRWVKREGSIHLGYETRCIAFMPKGD